MDELREKCKKTLNTLCEKYQTNSYMLEQLDTYLNETLEKALSDIHDTHQATIVRTNNLESQQNNFVKVFLSKNRYYYLSQNDTECFYEYDGKHYSMAKKDDIIQRLLVTISHYKDLHEWKFEVTDVIMKHIKERSLHATVPESSTIQYVLKLLTPSVFSSRDEAKYFLTVLGDTILKKNSDNIYLAHGKSKSLLTLLDTYAYITIGHGGLSKNFVKYHESHNYTNCRVVHFVGERETEITVNQSLDLFCVACHYSSRFGGGDEYIQKKAGEALKQYTLFLKNRDQQQIVTDFCDNVIDSAHESSPSQSTYHLKLKDIHYLWKSYLSERNLPNMIYFSAVKQILVQKYDFDAENDRFVNIASKHLPLVRKLLDFWESHVVSSTNDELEVDELCMLFNTHSGQTDETEALKIIHHFFPDIDVVDNKYIMNVSCDLWNKRQDIGDAMIKMKEQYALKNTDEFISFDDAYQYYCGVYKPKYVVNKRYFEKCVCEHVSGHVVYGTFISNTWYQG